MHACPLPPQIYRFTGTVQELLELTRIVLAFDASVCVVLICNMTPWFVCNSFRFAI